jgi:hypothetical protein
MPAEPPPSRRAAYEYDGAMIDFLPPLDGSARCRPAGAHQCGSPFGAGCVSAIVRQILAQMSSPARLLCPSIRSAYLAAWNSACSPNSCLMASAARTTSKSDIILPFEIQLNSTAWSVLSKKPQRLKPFTAPPRRIRPMPRRPAQRRVNEAGSGTCAGGSDWAIRKTKSL